MICGDAVFDTNKDGVISVEECRALLNKLGESPTDKQLQVRHGPESVFLGEG